MMRRKNEVRMDVFSRRLVVDSINENVFVKAAYGTLHRGVSESNGEKVSQTARLVSISHQRRPVLGMQTAHER